LKKSQIDRHELLSRKTTVIGQ